MKRKYYILQMIFILTLLFGCKFNSKYDIYFLNFKPESANIYKEIVKEYAKETNVKIKVETAASSKYEETLMVELLKSSVPTIFIINGPSGLKSWKDYALNLTEYHNKIKNISLIDNLLNQDLALTLNEDIYGLPLTTEGYGLIYNKLVFNEYFNLQTRTSKLSKMEDVKSYDELVTIVEDLNQYLIGNKELIDCPNIKKLQSVFSPVSLKTGSDWPYQTHLSSIAMFYEFNDLGDSFKGTETKDISFKYNKNMKSIFDLYIKYSKIEKNKLGDVSYDDSLNSFINGTSAIIQQGNWIMSSITNSNSTILNTYDVGMIPIYMGITDEENYGIAIGTENYLGINKMATKKQISSSIDFINWLYTSTTGIKYLTEKLEYLPPYNNIEFNINNSLNETILNYIENNTIKPVEWSFTYYPNESFKTTFGGALLDYVLEKITWENLVEIIIKSWKEESK